MGAGHDELGNHGGASTPAPKAPAPARSQPDLRQERFSLILPESSTINRATRRSNGRIARLFRDSTSCQDNANGAGIAADPTLTDAWTSLERCLASGTPPPKRRGSYEPRFAADPSCPGARAGIRNRVSRSSPRGTARCRLIPKPPGLQPSRLMGRRAGHRTAGRLLSGPMMACSLSRHRPPCFRTEPSAWHSRRMRGQLPPYLPRRTFR